MLCCCVKEKTQKKTIRIYFKTHLLLDKMRMNNSISVSLNMHVTQRKGKKEEEKIILIAENKSGAFIFI